MEQQTTPNAVVLHTYKTMLESRQAVLSWLEKKSPILSVTTLNANTHKQQAFLRPRHTRNINTDIIMPQAQNITGPHGSQHITCNARQQKRDHWQHQRQHKEQQHQTQRIQERRLEQQRQEEQLMGPAKTRESAPRAPRVIIGEHSLDTRVLCRQINTEIQDLEKRIHFLEQQNSPNLNHINRFAGLLQERRALLLWATRHSMY